MVSSMSRWAVSALCLLSCVTYVASQAYRYDATVKFFSTVTMTCDHPDVNITTKSNIRSLSWLFPDGRTINSDSYLNPSRFSLAEPDLDIPVAGLRSRLAGYSLTAYEVDADVFGYYSCIVVYDSPTDPISVIRWGLNVDGADYSDLMDLYKEGAIVGGVAAAVFFVLVVGTCIVWHYCFADNKGVIPDEDPAKEARRYDDFLKDKESTYVNSAYNGDVDTADVEVNVENAQGHNGLSTKM